MFNKINKRCSLIGKRCFLLSYPLSLVSKCVTEFGITHNKNVIGLRTPTLLSGGDSLMEN